MVLAAQGEPALLKADKEATHGKRSHVRDTGKEPLQPHALHLQVASVQPATCLVRRKDSTAAHSG